MNQFDKTDEANVLRLLNETFLTIKDVAKNAHVSAAVVRYVAAANGINIEERRLKILEHHSISKALEMFGDQDWEVFAQHVEACKIKNEALARMFNMNMSYLGVLLEKKFGMTATQRAKKVIQRKQTGNVVCESMSGDGVSLEWLSKPW